MAKWKVKEKKKKKGKRQSLEHENQVFLFQWAKLNERKYPELALLFAIPNGGARHIVVAQKLKREGVKSGVPDICLPVSCGKYHALYVELKRPAATLKNGEPSKAKKTTSEQDGWHARLRAVGNRVECCYGWQAAVNVIKKYLLGTDW